MENRLNSKRINILYVEDELDILHSMGNILSVIYSNVLRAENGKIGLEHFLSNKDEIDLILTDIRMPIMCGIEMIKEIKKIDVNIPIYVASGDIKLQNDIMKVGANRFFPKPLKLPDIISRIEMDLIK